MRDLLIATKNPGKFKEIKSAFEGSDFNLIFLEEILNPCLSVMPTGRQAGRQVQDDKSFGRDGVIDDSDFVEDGETFEENAEKKARYYYEKFGVLTLAEDSGIVVEALKDELGIKTRRWGKGESASDEEWLDFFMNRIKDEKNRVAEFVCCVCVYDGGKNINKIFRGQTKGVIADNVFAPILIGLPLSSVFVPEGMDKAYAQLTSVEKNRISHRGKAIGKAKEFLIK
ncbi:MAG: non-canonical purine NTP pyrophosphatase [Candidatus Gracilibacteria bacterium]|jgi:XTP/dITP diphosphohydrolase